MRRADVLALTGISEQAFDALSHRKLAPLEPQRRGTKGWATYRAADVLKLDLVLSLSKRGCDQAIAYMIVRDGFDLVQEAVQRNARQDIHFGYAEAEGFSLSHDDFGREEVVAASMRMPFAALEQDVATEAQHAVVGLSGTLASILTVNVSQRLRIIRARAELRPNAEALLGELDAVCTGAAQ